MFRVQKLSKYGLSNEIPSRRSVLSLKMEIELWWIVDTLRSRVLKHTPDLTVVSSTNGDAILITEWIPIFFTEIYRVNRPTLKIKLFEIRRSTNNVWSWPSCIRLHGISRHWIKASPWQSEPIYVLVQLRLQENWYGHRQDTITYIASVKHFWGIYNSFRKNQT